MIWIRRFLQYAIATILMATSVGKMLDVPGFIKVLATYQSFPEWSLPLVALSFVLSELKTAEILFRGKNLLLGSLLSAVMHAFFTAGAAISMLRGLDIPNCGCFGVFLARPLTWGTVTEDLVLLLASIGLLLLIRKEEANCAISSSPAGSRAA